MMVFCVKNAQPSVIAIKQKGLKEKFNIINFLCHLVKEPMSCFKHLLFINRVQLNLSYLQIHETGTLKEKHPQPRR